MVVEVVIVGVLVVVGGVESMWSVCVTTLAASAAPVLEVVVVVFGWVSVVVLTKFAGSQHLSAPVPTHLP